MQAKTRNAKQEEKDAVGRGLNGAGDKVLVLDDGVNYVPVVREVIRKFLVQAPGEHVLHDFTIERVEVYLARKEQS